MREFRYADFTFAYLLAAAAVMNDKQAFTLIFVFGAALDLMVGIPLNTASLVVIRYIFRNMATWFYEPNSIVNGLAMTALLLAYRGGVFVVMFQKRLLVHGDIYTVMFINLTADALLFSMFMIYLRRAPKRRRLLR